MSASTTNLAERASEIRAQAEAAMVARILGDLAIEPSGKKFLNSRASRLERWMQLAGVASRQAAGLQALSKAARVPKRKPAVEGTGVPITQINVEAAQETA